MDTQRLILLATFLFAGMMLWNAWQREHSPSPSTPVTIAATNKSPALSDLPSPTLVAPSNNSGNSIEIKQVNEQLQNAEKIKVKTNILRAEINTAGGDLRQLELFDHYDPEDKQKPYALIEDQPGHIYIAQSGLIGNGLPNHRTIFVVEPGPRELEEGRDKLEIRLRAPEVNGIKVTKIFTFHKNSYVINVTFEIENTSKASVQPFSYFQFLHDGKPFKGDSKWGVSAFTGPAVYTEQNKFKKIDFSDIDKGKADYPRTSDNGWIAMLQHYFLSAWLPDNNQANQKTPREFYTRVLGQSLYAIGVILPVKKIDPGATAAISVPLYAGPQEQEKLSALAEGLDLTVDYGWLTIIATPLFWLLQFFHKLVNNWGVAIILLTILIKAVFYPLSAASYRSMAKMRVIAPKLQKVKEQYGSDKQRLHQAMMELYKTEKINPLGGCLPVLIQIPVFIALYWVLSASVELRQAPFVLWIQDLSAQDPYFVLPIIMGITMVIQMKLSPAPPDPIQAKVMQIMPYMFTVFFLFFPAGLVLYWLVNNVLSIAQQWYITRKLEQSSSAVASRKR